MYLNFLSLFFTNSLFYVQKIQSDWQYEIKSQCLTNACSHDTVLTGQNWSKAFEYFFPALRSQQTILLVSASLLSRRGWRLSWKVVWQNITAVSQNCKHCHSLVIFHIPDELLARLLSLVRQHIYYKLYGITLHLRGGRVAQFCQYVRNVGDLQAAKWMLHGGHNSWWYCFSDAIFCCWLTMMHENTNSRLVCPPKANNQSKVVAKTWRSIGSDGWLWKQIMRAVFWCFCRLIVNCVQGTYQG